MIKEVLDRNQISESHHSNILELEESLDLNFDFDELLGSGAHATRQVKFTVLQYLMQLSSVG
jgi:hypothetical protein